MTHSTPSPVSRVSLTVDLVGVALFAALIGWLHLAARRAGGDPAPAVDLLLGVAAMLAAGRLFSFIHRWVVPAVLAGWAGWIALRDIDILLDGPLSSPLGYRNATAAFFVLATAAALMVAVRADGETRLFGIAAAVGFALVPLLNGSDAGVVTLLGLGFAAFALRGRRATRVLVVGCALAVVTAMAATMAVGWTYDARDRGGTLDRVVDATLSERRAVLWHDALQIMVSEPVTGVGPGNFAQHSPEARSDQDAVWAHNGYLEMGADAGVAGLILTLALVLWGFARLWVGPLDAGAAVAAVALAAFGVHTAIDYLLHFPEVPLAAAALVGAGSAAGLPRRRGRGARGGRTRRSGTGRISTRG